MKNAVSPFMDPPLVESDRELNPPIPIPIEAPSAILLAASSYPLERLPRVRIELAATQSTTGAPRRISQGKVELGYSIHKYNIDRREAYPL